MHAIVNHYHRFTNLVSGTLLFLITALVLAACSSGGGGGGGGADLVIEPANEGWDFQVTASVSSAVVAVGDSFTLTAMVSNASDASAPSPANTLTYYQSSDATIDSSDTELATDAVASLAVGASDTQDITPTAPTAASTYYYGACMPATGDELNASDNCSSGVAVTVTAGWDFQVTASVDSANVTGSTPFTLTAVVSNAGSASGPTPTRTLSYYQSSDATIDSSDTELDTAAVASLAAGASSNQSIDVTIASASGTYYYGACMPADSGDVDASNNCSSGVEVTVTSGWDFQVSLSVSSASVEVEEAFTVTAVVSNGGFANQPSPESTLSYYQSSDATISSADTELDTDAVASLAVDASDTQSFNATAPSVAGTYYYGACIPNTGNELETSDNCSAGVAVTVGGWDFQVTVSADSVVEGGQFFVLTTVISNASDAKGPTPASTLTYYQSSDATIDSTDTSLGTDPVASLAVDASDTENITLTAPAATGTYYYGGCMPATGIELNASDNCSLGVAVTVSTGWDFQVTASASSASILKGKDLTLTAEVSNASDALSPSPASRLSYYYSSDATIDSSDSFLASNAVPILTVGASLTDAITTNTVFLAHGTYYFGACMPATAGDANASDNCSAGVAVTVTGGWDFQVNLSVSSASVEVGDSLTLTAVVKNADGAALPTPEGTLLYEELDSDYNVTLIGMDTVPILAVGDSSTQDFSTTAPATAGSYTYRACAPFGGMEQLPGDNCSSLVAVTVTSSWDFTVTASVDNTSVAVGDSFTLTAMVSNASDASAPTPANTLRYYQSSDATISSADTELDTDAVAVLAAGDSSSQDTTPTAPATAGTYYYGACMPATGDEANAADNCSAGVAVIVGGWDFQVTASVSSANVSGSTPFTLTAMVSNASSADGSTPTSTLTYYQSSDATIDSNDTPQGTDPVASLAAGTSDTYSIDPTAPTASGTYYYGACMPATGTELNATDNCSSGVAVTFTSGWDFQVAVSASGANALTNQTFTLTAEVSNAGIANQATSASTLTYYQSSDATISSSDTSLGTDPVASLAVNASDTQDITPTAPATAGTYYYGACMPATGNELNASDNCSSGVAITVRGWDFQVTASVSSTSVEVAEMFTLTAVVSNANDASVPAFASTLSYYQSIDATIDSTDTELDTDAVATLAAGDSSTQDTTPTAPVTAGTYYYGACMPATGSELDASDNCSAGVAVTVTGDWDFQVTASVSSTSVKGSQPFTLTAEVSNASSASGSAPASTLTYYQSSDATISSADTELDTDPVAILAAGNSSTHSSSVSIFMASGTYYYGACMPATGDEANATDNCSSGVAVTVTSGWNFAVTLEANSTSLEVGETLTLTAEVSNAGIANQPTPASTLTYTVNESGSTTFDTIGTDPVAILAAGDSSTETIDTMAPATAGTYIVIACMPTTGDELDSADNCSSGVAITVTAGWDFQVTVSASSTTIGGTESLTLTAEVSNASSANGPAPVSTLSYYQSSDATIDSTDSLLDTDAVASLAVGESSTQSAVIMATNTAPDTYYFGACMPATGDELNATDNCSGVAVTVSGWDFQVTISVSSTSVEAGDTLTLTAVVGNASHASEPTPAETLTYYLHDGSSFTSVGTDPVSMIAVGESSTQTIDVMAPATAGTYVYHADISNGGRELAGDDNSDNTADVTVTASTGG
ncbi:MAG: beta strand repeat-containing protein [Gammaproteobacteria bacterium]